MLLDLLSNVSFLLAFLGGALLIGGFFRKTLIKFGLILIAVAILDVAMGSVAVFFGVKQVALLPIVLLLWVVAILIFALLKRTK